MNNNNHNQKTVVSQESEFSSMAERHHQIMMEGDRFLRRLVWGCVGLAIIVGAVIFYFVKYDPFWKYP